MWASVRAICSGDQHPGHLSDAELLLDQTGQRHALFRLKLLVVSWGALHLRTLQGCRCCTSLLNPPVFQTALSDFYPEYRLVCQAIPTQPRPRAEVLSALHANIQDAFNEYGVQIMSPHYLGDPTQEKLVKKENWFAAPAKSVAGGSRSPTDGVGSQG
jgi:hypothetical protein